MFYVPNSFRSMSIRFIMQSRLWSEQLSFIVLLPGGFLSTSSLLSLAPFVLHPSPVNRQRTNASTGKNELKSLSERKLFAIQFKGEEKWFYRESVLWVAFPLDGFYSLSLRQFHLHCTLSFFRYLPMNPSRAKETRWKCFLWTFVVAENNIRQYSFNIKFD